ncbi:BSD domain-containing protein [Citrus sinensis]|nr:BSD domain-containing protein [Citrus sinensis]
MESFWNKAKTFAEEAANKSQSLTNSTKIADLFAETAKKSKEFALEASKKADEFKTAALKQADQIPIKSITDIIPPQLASSLSSIASSSSGPTVSDLELQKFGITDDLRDFVKGLTSSTFQNFPIQDEAEASDVPNTTSNVRKDLTEWQERHATLVLATVKGISKLRYELCPRVMKERKFWKIYFTLVSTHVAPYEKQYMEEIKLKDEKKMTDDTVKPTPIVGETSKSEVTEKNLKSRTSTSSSIEQDLDTYLLGDLEESDGIHCLSDDGDESFDDDFDQIGNSVSNKLQYVNQAGGA